MTDQEICENCPFFIENDKEGLIGCEGYKGDWADPQSCLEENPELAND